MKYNYLEDAEKFALENCKILYKDIHKPCSETCACWGWEFHSGWNDVVKELSVKLETLNLIFYPKYGVHVVMEQAKEKYGYLHFYYSVRIEMPFILRIWRLPFEKAYRWLQSNIDFKMKCITDREAYYSDDVENINEEDVSDIKERYKNCSNVKVKMVDNKWVKITHVWHCPSTHFEPTQHKLLFKIRNMMHKISNILYFTKEPSYKQRIIQEAVESIAGQYVREAEEKCYNVCEECGTQIGTDFSPRIATKGWISYICDKCDIKRTLRYAINSTNTIISKHGIKLTDEELNKIKSVESMLNSEDYISIDEFKNAETEIKCICDKIDKELEKTSSKKEGNK